MTPFKIKRSRRPDDGLPEFERPPLAEVVLGVQFDPIVGLTAAHLGTIWDRFRKDFPRTEDRPTLATAFERLGPLAEPATVQLDLNLMTRPPLPRCWFINEVGDELLQFQQDRFHHNWRRMDAGRTYPRYEKLRERFGSELETVESIVVREKLGTVLANQCELTYINNIVAGQGWDHYREAGKVFGGFAASPQSGSLGNLEHLRYETAHPITLAGGRVVGRLWVSVVSGLMKDGGIPMFAMTLTARGEPLGKGRAGVIKFLDLGHRSIVKGFAELTTPHMHEAWGRTR